QPEHKTRRRIKLQAFRCQQVPSQPKHGPDQDSEEKPHGADAIGDPTSQPIYRAQFLGGFPVDVSERLPLFLEFVERKRAWKFYGRCVTHSANSSHDCQTCCIIEWAARRATASFAASPPPGGRK